MLPHLSTSTFFLFYRGQSSMFPGSFSNTFPTYVHLWHYFLRLLIMLISLCLIWHLRVNQLDIASLDKSYFFLGTGATRSVGASSKPFEYIYLHTDTQGAKDETEAGNRFVTMNQIWPSSSPLQWRFVRTSLLSSPRILPLAIRLERLTWDFLWFSL